MLLILCSISLLCAAISLLAYNNNTTQKLSYCISLIFTSSLITYYGRTFYFRLKGEDTIFLSNSEGESIPRQKPSLASIASLFMGILSIIILGDLAGILAIACAYIAFTKMDHSPRWKLEKMICVAGLVLGGISIIAAFVPLPFVIPPLKLTLSPFSITERSPDS
ncbi:MAG: hypothetical protein ABIP97_08270, partial [Chthoniobacterales bacterium]